ncbi:hypothetical protein ACFSTD_14395 [Novosphingobium colocasiae]|uniref:Uncharacterized protein n=1 Tax=Novosphingobium colocasiae TaxID=1256513 RepID=A0A918PHJ8_9SPHN|nr:hypothetical protein [Novosphingobium colocasiae]GGZ10262.1 hypothetical protein GCM10011614_26460 [Novosphingobium colocasiae]
MGIAVFKGLIPSFILTWVLSTIMGSNQVRHGMLQIEHTYFQSFDFYWSWPLFLVSLALSTAIFWMMD